MLSSLTVQAYAVVSVSEFNLIVSIINDDSVLFIFQLFDLK